MIDIKKRNIIYLIFIVLLALFFFRNYAFQLDEQFGGDLVLFYLPRATFVQQSIQEHGNVFPEWNPYVFSGTPYYSRANALGFNYLLGPFLLFLKPLAAIKLSLVLGIILAGIAMYWLVYEISKSPEASLVSSLVFMFNGYILVSIFHWGWVPYAYAYPLTPLVILFVIKALKEKAVIYSILAGLCLALQIHAGTGIIFLYTTLAVNLCLLVWLIGKGFKKRLSKVLLVGFIMYLFAFGFAALKILPVQGPEASNRILSYEETSGRSLLISDLFKALVESPLQGLGYPQTLNSKIGIIAVLLAAFAIVMRWRNKNILFFSLVCLFSVLISMDTFFQYALWKFYPAWTSMRYANRGLFLFVTFGSILAGLGAYYFSSFLKDKLKLSDKKMSAAFIVLVLLIVFNLLVFGVGPTRYDPNDRYTYFNIEDAVSQNEVMQYISDQPGLFRMHVFEIRGIDWGTEFYTLPLGLEQIYGYESIWNPEYFNEYLGLALRDPPKFWGILNTKYLTSTVPLNISGLTFIKKFGVCASCFPTIPELSKGYGPYLYENDLFVPRMYLVDNAILVLGPDGSGEGAAKNIMYALLLSQKFNPMQSVVVIGKSKISYYSLAELSRYKALILGPGSISQSDFALLQDYVNKGGIILPDFLHDKNDMSNSDIDHLFGSFANETAIVVSDSARNIISFEKNILTLPDAKNKFLVLSETYSLYDSWSAVADSYNLPILRADGVVSAVYLDKPYDRIAFTFRDKSFMLGKWITAFTFIIAISYFVFMYFSKKKPIKADQEPANQAPKTDSSEQG